ncbi:uncharacterized protein ACB058_016802 [Synchiropus picturatus]
MMSGDQPPPYGPPQPVGASAPGFPSAYNSAAFPGTSYQSYPPQTFPGGQPPSVYHVQPSSASGPFMNQPGYQGYSTEPQGSSYPWDDIKTYGEQPKHTVFLLDQNRGGTSMGGGAGGAMKSCLSACSAALCCCCLWDLLTQNFC